MKIGIVCYPTFGGSGVVATELGMGLAAKGHEVHFITYRRPARLSTFHTNVFYHEVTGEGYPLFEYPPYDTALASKLVEVVSGYTESHNIVLAPMSTKLSTLASLLVVEKYPDIQVTYCLPGEYNVEDYSKGVRALYSQTLLPRNNQVQIS